jgi:hypothetical protein
VRRVEMRLRGGVGLVMTIGWTAVISGWCWTDDAADPPRLRAALVCRAYTGEDSSVWITGGIVEGHGWVGEADVRKLIHKEERLSGWEGMLGPVDPRQNALVRRGDRLSVYSLESGEVGEAQVTDDGEIFAGYEGQHGIRFHARIRLTRPPSERRQAARRMPAPWSKSESLEPELFAVWSQGMPQPRWVKAEIVDRGSARYRRIVEEWLRAKGIPEDAIKKTVVQQIVRADLDGDTMDEVFLSFLNPDVIWPSGEEAQTHVYSYLVMRDLDAGSGKVRTHVVAYSEANRPYTVGDMFWVDGFCDVDRDGRAEVLVHSAYYEGDGVDMLRWTGKGFKVMEGPCSAP